jgi:hypothetical protein
MTGAFIDAFVPSGSGGLQQSPRAAGTQNVENGVEQVTLGNRAGAPRLPHLAFRQQRPYELPLFIRKVAGIRLHLAHVGIIPTWSIANSL